MTAASGKGSVGAWLASVQAMLLPHRRFTTRHAAPMIAMEDRLRSPECTVAGIGSRLEDVLPTLATKSDLREALPAQTRRIITAAFGLAGIDTGRIEISALTARPSAAFWHNARFV